MLQEMLQLTLLFVNSKTFFAQQLVLIVTCFLLSLLCLSNEMNQCIIIVVLVVYIHFPSNQFTRNCRSQSFNQNTPYKIEQVAHSMEFNKFHCALLLNASMTRILRQIAPKCLMELAKFANRRFCNRFVKEIIRVHR